MKRLAKYGLGLAIGLGAFYGATRDPVIDAAPEPFKTGLKRIKLDMARIESGQGWKGQKKPGSANEAPGGGIPLLQSHGVGN
jgi:hypothetical protein